MKQNQKERTPYKKKHMETTFLLNEWVDYHRKNIFKAMNTPPSLHMAYFIGDFSPEERDKWLEKAKDTKKYKREYQTFAKAYDRLIKLLKGYDESALKKTLRPEEIKTSMHNYDPAFAKKFKTIDLKQDNTSRVKIILTNDGVNQLNENKTD